MLGGTIGEMHAKKIASVYDMAMKMGAPVIGLLDCAGVRLQESVDALQNRQQLPVLYHRLVPYSVAVEVDLP